jgi:CheY-like chemotaxis protein
MVSQATRPVVHIVDDNEANRAILVDYLEQMGVDSLEIDNGVLAIDKARTLRPDLILLDILMPELDGRAVLEVLKTDPVTRMIPIIIITALDDDYNAVNCIERGAEDYIPKPFNPSLLRARVRSCLEKKLLLDELRSSHPSVDDGSDPDSPDFRKDVAFLFQSLEEINKELRALSIKLSLGSRVNEETLSRIKSLIKETDKLPSKLKAIQSLGETG